MLEAAGDEVGHPVPVFEDAGDDDTYRKQLASLARAGFSFATAKAVMALGSADEAEELAESLRQM